MAIDFISIDSSKKYGRRFERFVSMLREVQDLGDELTQVVSHLNDGSDYAAVATTFGVPAGTGATIAALIAAANSRVKHAGVTDLIDRVG